MIDNHLCMAVGHGWDLGVPETSKWKRVRQVSSSRTQVPHPRRLTATAPLEPTLSLCWDLFRTISCSHPVLLLPKGWSSPSPHRVRLSRPQAWGEPQSFLSRHRMQGRSLWLWLEMEFENRSLSGGKSFPAGSGRRPPGLSGEPLTSPTLSLSWTAPLVRASSSYTLEPNLLVT